MAELTAEKARELLSYDAVSGNLIWKRRSMDLFPSRKAWAVWNGKYAGKVAGTRHKDGYVQIKLEGKFRKAHRVIWLIVTGGWPPRQVDHESCNNSENSWKNLRDASNKDNLGNTRPRAWAAVSLKGVFMCREKFKAQISIENKSRYLGVFDCPAAASFAYQVAADKHFGKFARYM